MSNNKETQDHHWKMTVNRKNRMESTFQSSAKKKKFTPLKDNSMRDSKIFERSRQRSNSSFVGLNRSRDIDTVSVKQKKDNKATQSTRQIQPQQSVMISTIKNSQFRLSDSISVARQHASAFNTVVQLQKQFKQFKQKVMKLIQRQQQQINKLAKQIVNTFQFQLEKLKNQKVNKCEHCLSSLDSNRNQPKSLQPQRNLSTNSKITKQGQNKPKVKQIQQIKQQLNKKLQKTEAALKTNQRIKALQKTRSTREIPVINFEKIHSRFNNVFDIFDKLKSDMNQMEQIRASLQKKTDSNTNLANQTVPKSPTKK